MAFLAPYIWATGVAANPPIQATCQNSLSWMNVDGVINYFAPASVEGLSTSALLPKCTNTCSEVKKAVIMLHGTSTNTAILGGADITDPVNKATKMVKLQKYFYNNCVAFVVPEAGIKYSHRRWDTDNQYNDPDYTGGSEKQALINLMNGMENYFGIDHIVLMGGSSGAVMVHNIIQDNELDVLKGFVIGDGASANQTHYLSQDEVDLVDAILEGVDDDEFLSFNDDCNDKPYPYLNQPLFLASENSFNLGIYSDDSALVTDTDPDVKAPILVIYSDNDDTIPTCLKEELADGLLENNEYVVTKQEVSGGHDGSVWSSTTMVMWSEVNYQEPDEAFNAIKNFYNGLN